MKRRKTKASQYDANLKGEIIPGGLEKLPIFPLIDCCIRCEGKGVKIFGGVTPLESEVRGRRVGMMSVFAIVSESVLHGKKKLTRAQEAKKKIIQWSFCVGHFCQLNNRLVLARHLLCHEIYI
jgi:hypothetical protein